MLLVFNMRKEIHAVEVCVKVCSLVLIKIIHALNKMLLEYPTFNYQELNSGFI